MTDFRPATDAEILADNAWNLKHNYPVRFRHFVRELYSPNARNGVQHRQFSRSKLTVIDGVVHVRHHGEMVKVAATVTHAAGKDIVFDLRVASAYLP